MRLKLLQCKAGSKGESRSIAETSFCLANPEASLRKIEIFFSTSYDFSIRKFGKIKWLLRVAATTKRKNQSWGTKGEQLSCDKGSVNWLCGFLLAEKLILRLTFVFVEERGRWRLRDTGNYHHRWKEDISFGGASVFSLLFSRRSPKMIDIITTGTAEIKKQLSKPYR